MADQQEAGDQHEGGPRLARRIDYHGEDKHSSQFSLLNYDPCRLPVHIVAGSVSSTRLNRSAESPRSSAAGWNACSPRSVLRVFETRDEALRAVPARDREP